MLNKNSVGLGLLIGSILPAICWVLCVYIFRDDAFILDKPAAPYLIAIGLNLVILRYFFKINRDDTAKGIMMLTFAFMLVIFVFKIHIT